jgi:hypothetical protein
MSNITWIAIFIVAVIVFTLRKRPKKKSAKSPSKPPSKTTHATGDIPDGQYLVKYVDESSEGETKIIIGLEVTEGELKGAEVPMIFENAAAKRVLKDATGGFVSRLAFEEVALANKLEDNIRGDADHSFLIRTKGGKAVSVYTYNDEKIKTFMNKLAKDPSFIG